MRSTSEVLAGHLACFAARDLDGLLSDDAADAVFFNADGAQRGVSAIRAPEVPDGRYVFNPSTEVSSVRLQQKDASSAILGASRRGINTAARID